MPLVDEASLLAIIKLTKEENDWGGVMDAMREGASNASVAEAGCRALMNLIHNNADNRKRIGEAGGIAMILSMMEVHGASNAEVAKQGCWALSNLACNNADNKKSIGEADGIAMVLSMMEVHGASSAEVAEEACGALFNLAFNDDNKRKILAANGVSMVERMKSTWARNAGVKKYADMALSQL